MTYPISDITRRVVYTGSLGTGPYPFTFEVLEEGDIGVYKNETLLTLTTDYTVTINADGTGSVTLVSAAIATDTVAIFGDKGIQRQTDFTTGGDLFANSLNDELDAQTIFAQQNAEAIVRAIRAPQFDPTSVDMVLPSASDRADAVLTFDTNGDVLATPTNQLLASLIGANYVTSNATGDGSTVEFTVSTAPGSKGNIQIYIDGVYQNKSSFSVDGTIVTFTEAPPLNASIEFIIGYSLGSFSNAGDVPFTRQDTGAQTRTVENKLQDVVSVKDFGATGDGVTDDTAAIQAAIDSGASGIYFPDGMYLIIGGNPTTKTIAIPQSVYMFGSSGAVITTENANDSESTSTSYRYVLIDFQGDYSQVTGLQFRGAIVGFSGNTKLIVDKCKFYNLWNSGIQGGASSTGDLIVTSCDFETTLHGAGAQACIQRGGTSGDGWMNSVSITDCSFNGVAQGINFHKTKQVSITNCSFNSAGASAGSSIKIDVANEKLIIRDCVFDGTLINGASSNKYLNSSPAYGTFIYQYNDSDVVVDGCVFKNYSDTQNILHLLDGSAIDSRISITNNLFLDNDGLTIYRPQGDVLIQGNKFDNCTSTSSILGIAGNWIRLCRIESNNFIASKLVISNAGQSEGSIYRIEKNSFDHSSDANGAIVVTDIGSGTRGTVYANYNKIELSGTAASTVGINASSSSYKIKAERNEIYNGSANPYSNVILTYEEGTFTPVVKDGASGTSATAASTLGRFTKNGNRVQFTIALVNIDTTGLTGGNTIYITDLPYTASNVTNLYTTQPIFQSAVTSTEGVLLGLVYPNTNYMTLSNGTTTTSTAATISQITSGTGDLYIVGDYMTDE